jgi:hypothetical protein
MISKTATCRSSGDYESSSSAFRNLPHVWSLFLHRLIDTRVPDLAFPVDTTLLPIIPQELAQHPVKTSKLTTVMKPSKPYQPARTHKSRRGGARVERGGVSINF